jgi:uncharacterized membrane protein
MAHDGHKHQEAEDTLKTDAPAQATEAHHHEHEEQAAAITAFPNYHPLVVHFPIVLLLMAVLFQMISFFFLKKEFGIATLILLALGVLSAWLSSNVFHAHTGELSGNAKEILEQHERMAALTWWFALTALLFKGLSVFLGRKSLLLEILVALVLTVSAVTVSIAGHHGATLVHLHGVGPQGRFLESHHHHSH